MGENKTLNGREKFTHATVGSLRNFEGKQFVKDATGAISCEIGAKLNDFLLSFR